MLEHLFQLPTVYLFYTDPGSGALILQLIFASIVGSLFYVRRFYGRIRGVFARNETSGVHDETNRSGDRS